MGFNGNIPSGNLSHNYGKIHHFLGKSTISMVIFMVIVGYFLAILFFWMRNGGANWLHRNVPMKVSTQQRAPQLGGQPIVHMDHSSFAYIYI